METNKEKLYILKLNNGTKEMTESSSLNPYLGITRIEDAEKHFAAEYYIGVLKKYKKQLNSEPIHSNKDRVKELLYSMKNLLRNILHILQKNFFHYITLLLRNMCKNEVLL